MPSGRSSIGPRAGRHSGRRRSRHPEVDDGPVGILFEESDAHVTALRLSTTGLAIANDNALRAFDGEVVFHKETLPARRSASRSPDGSLTELAHNSMLGRILSGSAQKHRTSGC